MRDFCKLCMFASSLISGIPAHFRTCPAIEVDVLLHHPVWGSYCIIGWISFCWRLTHLCRASHWHWHIDHLPKLLIPLHAKARSSEIHDRFINTSLSESTSHSFSQHLTDRINTSLIESTSHWFKKLIRYTIIAETTTYSIDTSHTSHQPPQSTPSTYNAHCVPFIVQNGI